MNRLFFTLLWMAFASAAALAQQTADTAAWQLMWHDEFDSGSTFDPTRWQAERGFVRNEEDQWYQADNAYILNGLLIIEGRIDSIPNPHYTPPPQRLAQSTPIRPIFSRFHQHARLFLLPVRTHGGACPHPCRERGMACHLDARHPGGMAVKR